MAPDPVCLFHGLPQSWDEQGNRVVHPDPNIRTTSYQCSNGHHWDEKTCGGKPYPEEKEKA